MSDGGKAMMAESDHVMCHRHRHLVCRLARDQLVISSGQYLLVLLVMMVTAGLSC